MRELIHKPELRQKKKKKRQEARARSLFASFSDAMLNIYIVLQYVIDAGVVLGTSLLNVVLDPYASFVYPL